LVAHPGRQTRRPGRRFGGRLGILLLVRCLNTIAAHTDDRRTSRLESRRRNETLRARTRARRYTGTRRRARARRGANVRARILAEDMPAGWAQRTLVTSACPTHAVSESKKK